MKLCKYLFIFFLLSTLNACSETSESTTVDLATIDSDGDGVIDSQDAFPDDSSETLDTDQDGIGNNADEDDDGDNVVDEEDAFPLDESEQFDTDSDSLGNNSDDDDDNDGVLDSEDAFPLDNTEYLDTDGDGVGNNSDDDDDGDGVVDGDDEFPLDPSRSADLTDTDGDGVIDSQDAYSNDANCSAANDGDGQSCFLSLLGALQETPIIKNDDDYIYFDLSTHSQILRLNTKNQSFEESVNYDSSKELRDFLYHEMHEKFYFTYTDPSITSMNLGETEEAFAEQYIQDHDSCLGYCFRSKYLFSVGEWLATTDGELAQLYDSSGNLVESLSIQVEFNLDYQILSMEWDDENNKVIRSRDVIGESNVQKQT